MNFNAVKPLLAPMSDERFEALLRHQPCGGQEGAVTLEDVGLTALARRAVAERDGPQHSDPAEFS
jgi:hypothetical protein